jgi:hypothetical protein
MNNLSINDNLSIDDNLSDINIFGNSPYIHYDSVSGGDIKLKSQYGIYLLWAVLIIIILYFIYIFYSNNDNSHIKINKPIVKKQLVNTDKKEIVNTDKKQLDNYYNKVSGDTYDKNAKKALQYGEKIDNPSAIDHFRMGTIYLVNQKNHEKAHEHFKAALNQVIEGKVDIKEVPYVVNRIDDFKDHFIDYPEIDDLPMQEALLAFYNRQREEIIKNTTDTKVETKLEISSDDPEYKQKVLLAKQEWISDSQNVHDSTMYQILKEQYELVNTENYKIKNIQLHDYNEAVNWLKHKFKDDNDKLAKLHIYLNTLNNNYPIGLIPGVKEQDIITAVWRRSFDPENKDKDIKEALADSVLDCIERGSLVCMSGRTKKIWQSLAYNDKDEAIGIFKSKQAIRNEIFQKCAKIINDYVGSDGTVSEQLKNAYINDENTEQVNELKSTIKKQMDNIIGDYKDLLPDEQLRLIIDECKVNV